MKPLSRLRPVHLVPALLLPGFVALGSAQSSPLTAASQEQAASDAATRPIARIEGDDIAVRGQVNLEHETGRNLAELTSGSEVTVRSKYARIELTGGGEIGICGPAKFSLLRSGAAVTLALDYGHIHVRLNEAQPVVIYTPLIVATPVAISEGKDEVQVGLEQTGKMCVFAVRGAVRLEPQFGGQTVVVPQNTQASLSEGRLDSVAEVAGSCHCDALQAFAAPPPPPVRVEASVLAGGADASSALSQTDPAAPPKPAVEEPIWKVVMPPLSFGAGSPAASVPPKPETILLLREVRVANGAVFHGSVAPPARETNKTSIDSKGKLPAATATAAPKKLTFGQRVRNFFRRLFGGKPKPDAPEARS